LQEVGQKMSSFKMASLPKIENYAPEKIEAAASPHAVAFMKDGHLEKKDFFELNPEISHFIGLTDAKTKEEKRKFDTEVLKYVQKIKDAAFEESYRIGLEQGIEEAKKEALEKAQKDISLQLSTFAALCEKINNMNQKIFEQNEKDIIELSYLMAEKIVMQTMEKKPEIFLNVFKGVIKSYPTTHVQVSEKDFAYLEKYKNDISTDIDFNKLKIEVNKELQSGDILFSNEMGLLDGTLASRFDLLKKIVTDSES
jgi:flagellar biosynthesis/type III secretory pathway protein FliH